MSLVFDCRRRAQFKKMKAAAGGFLLIDSQLPSCHAEFPIAKYGT
jgi:hypothetical protein